MKIVPLAIVKNDLSRYVDRARRGTRTGIGVRGVLVAQIAPIEPGWEGEVDWGLDDLEREGVVRRGARAIRADVLDKPGPRVGGDAVAALLEERRSGR